MQIQWKYGWVVCVLLGASSFGIKQGIAEEKTYALSPVNVIGSKENIRTLAGSGSYIDLGELQNRNYDDINRVLRRAPGVYIREEDGFGIFPNISLRGVDPGRSTKITLMEDGVLTAPAPYAAPALYFSPTVGRMSGVEVLKGSSQVKYGPGTSGGVVNYLSTPIPAGQSGKVRSLYGTDHESRNHIEYGDTIETDLGRVGFLVEYYDRRTEGFKTIDGTDGFTDIDRTGFRKQEPVLKLMWEPKTDRYQRLELKLNYSETVAHETYMGLNDEDFDADPFRRYAGSRFDRISTRFAQSSLRHQIELSSNARLTTKVYYHEFKRNWFKDRSSPADLMDPAKLAVLKGEAAGTLRYRNNNREYYSGGIESILNITTQTGDITHDWEFGARVHKDQVSRFQRDDSFVQDANGNIIERIKGAPGSGGNRKEDAEALALFAQDTLRTGPWAITPGLRYERVEMKYRDFDTSGADPGRLTGSGSDTLDIFAPGLGLVYELSDESTLFAGVHRGFALPGPRASAKDGIEEETSIGYEVGARFDNRSGFMSEATLFYTDFEDLIVPDLQGAGGLPEGSENAGEVSSAGLELQLAYDAGVANDWGVSNPWYLTATFTQAELESDSPSLDAESIFSGGKKGNNVPYVPEYQFLIGTGLETTRWGAFVDVIIVDSTFTTASNVDTLEDPTGKPNAAFGKTDSYVVVDLSGYLRLRENVKLIGSIHNAFDEEYLAARHPTGPRPGRPLAALAGVEVVF